MAPTQFLCTSCKKPFPQSQLLSTLSHRSQLLDVVRSNRAPSDWEALHIRSVVDFAQSELSRYDTEISRLRSALEKLEADRDILHAYYDVCRGVLPPIQSLPAEVLLDIFALCSPKLSKYDASSDYREAPLMELQRLMKFPSSSFPRFARAGVGSSKKEQILEILQTIMDRSGNVPLTIEIETHPGHTLELARLAQSSERWVTVSFIGAVIHLRPISSVRGRLPLLKSLELRSWGTERLALAAFAVAPRLTELRIGGSIEGLEQLPLHQIRRLTMLLEDLFACFTLPSSERFVSRPKNTPPCRSPGRMPNFSPSLFGPTFHSHLRVLDLAHAILSPIELFQLLQSLQSLESLAISDPPPTFAFPAVVTDTLLHDLTLEPPFTDRVLLDFVSSRLGVRPFATTLAAAGRITVEARELVDGDNEVTLVGFNPFVLLPGIE
ncbi:hypothetical protein B0H13DRAFT_2673767 [Mycena leptocephala]|nr:hypothetical protein B0H13DRAFT_2673767 [Mycena leptocephala]